MPKFKYQKNAGIHPAKEVRDSNSPQDRLKRYQEICEKIRLLDIKAKNYLDIYRENKGKWQEAVRQKNKTIEEMMEFHNGR